MNVRNAKNEWMLKMKRIFITFSFEAKVSENHKHKVNISKRSLSLQKHQVTIYSRRSDFTIAD